MSHQETRSLSVQVSVLDSGSGTVDQLAEFDDLVFVHGVEVLSTVGFLDQGHRVDLGVGDLDDSFCYYLFFIMPLSERISS